MGHSIALSPRRDICRARKKKLHDWFILWLTLVEASVCVCIRYKLARERSPHIASPRSSNSQSTFTICVDQSVRPSTWNVSNDHPATNFRTIHRNTFFWWPYLRHLISVVVGKKNCGRRRLQTNWFRSSRRMRYITHSEREREPLSGTCAYIHSEYLSGR